MNWKKPFVVLSFLLTMTSSYGVDLISEIVDKSSDHEADHYICLTGDWEKENPAVAFYIARTKKDFPTVFKDLSEDRKNCFAPGEQNEKAQAKLDLILKTIEQGAKKFHAHLNADGSILRKKEEPKIILRNDGASLTRRMMRAELFIGGAELVGMGALIALPRSITKWEEDWMEDAANNLNRAWSSPPVWDKDDFFINYIGHPLAGALYYNALRSQGSSVIASFLFSTLQSTIWEYTIEAVAEQPSIQDLFITPIVGSVIGELSHRATLRMARNGFSFGEKVLITIINPSYVINNGYRVKYRN